MTNQQTSVEREANKLINWGYRRVSNTHLMLSRIDRADWYRHMAQKHAPWDPNGQGIDWVWSMGSACAEDHYRRVYSKDTITRPKNVFELIPSSGGSVTGYCNKKGEPARYDVCRGDIPIIYEEDEMSDLELKNLYKIHSLNVVNGKVVGTRNQKFYSSEDEATDKAIYCVEKDDCQIVIFKAIRVVRRNAPPIEVTDVETGEVLQ